MLYSPIARKAANGRIWLIYLIGVLRCPQEYYTSVMVASIMVGGEQAVPGGKPMTMRMLLQTFPLRAAKEASMSWT